MRTHLGSALTLATLLIAIAPDRAAGLPIQQQPAAPGQQRAAAKPDPITPAQLASRKDLWPQRVTLRKAYRLEGGISLRAGQEVGLQDYSGADVVIDTGTTLFQCPAADTDLLERAQALIASLTPEQFALSWDVLRSRPDLWPVRVTLSVAVQLGDGSAIPAGRQVAVRDIQQDNVSVYDREIANFFPVGPQETDIVAQARARLALPAAERTPFFIRSVEAALQPREGAGEHPLAGADYVLVYTGRLGCPRCAAFLPELKEFQERIKAEHPHVQFVLMSGDPTAEAAKTYVEEAHFPGDVIAYDRRLEAATLASIPITLLPGLFVFDSTGKLIDRNHPDGGKPTALDVLGKFEQGLKSASAAPAPR